MKDTNFVKRNAFQVPLLIATTITIILEEHLRFLSDRSKPLTVSISLLGTFLILERFEYLWKSRLSQTRIATIPERYR